MYVGFINLEKVYDRVKWMALFQVLRKYEVGGKLVNGIKTMYVNSLACIRIVEDVSGCFRIKSGVRQGFIISSWLLNMYMNAMMKELKMGMERLGVIFQCQEKREGKTSEKNEEK